MSVNVTLINCVRHSAIRSLCGACFLAGGLLSLSLLSPVSGQAAVPENQPQPASAERPAAGKGDYKPHIAAASDEGERALGRFQKPAGFTVKLVAAEPLLANPVAFCFDEQGRIYVCETFRQGKGVEDNRGHMNWLDDDLAAQTVEDRLAFFKKHQKEKVQEYTREQDRIRLLEDTDGDGVYEKATIFADGFNDILDGTGSGVLAWKGKVYYTCIPHLWQFEDRDNNGQAEIRKSLHYGYGVRVAFRGHDSHGLRIGPDGRLYFSIGDRGYNITTEGKTLARPDCGAVFRCELDGSNLEVFAYGLRNPQELAFDDYGNLFTGDNNSDSGDRARWVHVVPGGDTGWRMNYQYLNDRGPWNREKLWHPAHPGQPAYIVPPISNYADGPSGLTYYPGVGLDDKYRGHFFLADFRGGPANSGIRTFKLQPKGASFEQADSEQFLWQILATDVEFADDGSVYVADWVDGWNGEGKGRIYRFEDPNLTGSDLARQTQKLLRGDFSKLPAGELQGLLRHPDQRVRQAAQFALVALGADGAQTLVAATQQTENQMARIHGLWGLGQLGRKQPSHLQPAIALLTDGDAEIRAQAAKVLGEAVVEGAAAGLVTALNDDSPRVRFMAALSLAPYHSANAITPLATALEANADADPTLRHAVVMGLTGSAQPEQLVALLNSGNVSVRLGAILALRRHQSPLLANTLQEADPRVLDEAIRAIHDEPITTGFPALAALATRSQLTPESWRRVLNANFRLGEQSHALAVASVAARAELPDDVRIEALRCLADWANPSSRDRVLGSWRPLSPRDGAPAAEAFQAHLGGMFSGSNNVRQVAAEVAGKLGVKEVGPVLARIAGDAAQSVSGRVAALEALATLKDSSLQKLVPEALQAEQSQLRATAQRILVQQNPEQALQQYAVVFDKGTQLEQQAALPVLAGLKTQGADQLLAAQIQRLASGKLPAELTLDVLEAAGQRKDVAGIGDGLGKYEAARPKEVAWSQFAETLRGGDADRGRVIFFERAQVSCVRCHKISGQGGEVGPELTKVGAEKAREYILESLVAPNAQIAKGFETITLLTTDGRTHSGIVKQETADAVTILTAEAKLLSFPKTEIEERVPGKSSMPEGLPQQLSKRDLRDLIEFLATRKP